MDRWLDGRVSPQVERFVARGWTDRRLRGQKKARFRWALRPGVGLGRRRKVVLPQGTGPRSQGEGLGPKQRPTLSQPSPSSPHLWGPRAARDTRVHSPRHMDSQPATRLPTLPCGSASSRRRSRPLRGVTGQVLNNSRLSLGPLEDVPPIHWRSSLLLANDRERSRGLARCGAWNGVPPATLDRIFRILERPGS